MTKMSKQEVFKSIYENHNHSWYEDLVMRNKDRLNNSALFFRGTRISYGEFFDLVIDYARSLKESIIKRIDERLKGVLPEYMVPNYYKIRKSMPVHPNGKRDIEALKKDKEDLKNLNNS